MNLARHGPYPRRLSKSELPLESDPFLWSGFARLVAEPAKSRRGGLRRRLVARAAEASGRILSSHRLRSVGCLVLSGPWCRRHARRIGPVLQAETAPQKLASRILCVGRPLDRKKQGCSESARCA